MKLRTGAAERTSILLIIFILMLGGGLVRMRVHAQTRAHGDETSEPDWQELNASMEKMHMAMGVIERSGDADVDFVRLMVPHHQGAIDMAKVQLLHGKDPQMRRLAEEIITDQQLEIELMQRWLKARVAVESKENGKAAATAKKNK